MPESFTQATPPAEPVDTNKEAGPKGDIVSVDIEPPFSQYSAINNIPYTEKYFGVGGDDVETIESYARKIIEEQNLEDSIGAYESIMEDLIARIGINPHEKAEIKLYKVARFIELLSRNLSQEDRVLEMLERYDQAEYRKQLLKDKIYGK